jgi:hypothetical protein
VTFYYGFGLEMVETYDLDIPVTDCNEFLSNQVEVGSAGLTAGQMRFFPFALNPTEISEAAYFGKLLAHLAKGASYPQVEMDDSGASDQVRHTHTLTHSLTHSLTLTRTLSLSLSLSLTHTHTHTHTHSLTHTLTHSLTHSLTHTHTHTHSLSHTHASRLTEEVEGCRCRAKRT